MANACENLKFLEKIFSQEEILQKFSNKSLAGNFAVKEAFVKALGTGFREIYPNQISVLRDEFGKPYIDMNSYVIENLGKVKADKVHVSISHDKSSAIGFCVIE